MEKNTKFFHFNLFIYMQEKLFYQQEFENDTVLRVEGLNGKAAEKNYCQVTLMIPAEMYDFF